jgi:hypothetical protein
MKPVHVLPNHIMVKEVITAPSVGAIVALCGIIMIGALPSIKRCVMSADLNMRKLMMNERIQALMKQAMESTGVEGLGGSYMELNPEKLAKLIVEECVEQLELVRKYRYDRIQPLETQQTIIDECQYQIKQHFGVE